MKTVPSPHDDHTNCIRAQYRKLAGLGVSFKSVGSSDEDVRILGARGELHIEANDGAPVAPVGQGQERTSDDEPIFGEQVSGRSPPISDDSGRNDVRRKETNPDELEHRAKGVSKAMRKLKSVAGCCGRIAAAMIALVAIRSPAKEHTKLTTPSQLLKNPQKYDGQRVLVRGYLYVGPESRNLSDSKKAAEADIPNTCIGLSAPDIKFKPKKRVYNTAGIELDPEVNLVE